MAGNTSTEAVRDDINLRVVWQLVTDAEQTEFWKSAGQHAKNLSHRTTTYAQLCAAIKDAESCRTGGRPTIALPGAIRRLSSDEVKLKVMRLRSRLLDQPNAQSFLIAAFCNWIQEAHLVALLAVLDAMKCPHDERGTLKGVLPPFSPDTAKQSICALATDHSTHSLALVCGALMLNRDLWSGLATAFKALPNLEVPTVRSQEEMLPQSIQASDKEAPMTVEPPRASTITIDSLREIREGLDLLGQHLADARKEISDVKVPDLSIAIECWTQIHEQHHAVEAALGVSSPSVAVLETALARQSEIAVAFLEISRCRSIEHVADSSFAGCTVIQTKCDELKAILDSGQALDQSSWRAVKALLTMATILTTGKRQGFKLKLGSSSESR